MHKIKDINQGDLLTFKASDDKYKILLCTGTYKDRSPYNFTFAALTYDSIEKPTVEQVHNSDFFGIGNRKRNYFEYSDNELKRMWAVHPEIKPYDLSSYVLYIWRKDFMQFRNNFEFVDNIKIFDNLDKNSSSGINASDWKFLQDFFNQKYLLDIPYYGQTTFKVKAIMKD